MVIKVIIAASTYGETISAYCSAAAGAAVAELFGDDASFHSGQTQSSCKPTS